MQSRKPLPSVYGRPSGTDGSDYSYRMVVDSRYTKVAKGKTRLLTLIYSQAIVQLLGVVYAFLSTTKGESFDPLAIAAIVVGFISLLIGDLGRRRTQESLLKTYMFVSSTSLLLSVGSVVRSNFMLELLRDMSGWESKKFELLGIAYVLLGLILQLVTIKTVLSLICNMSPPKRSS